MEVAPMIGSVAWALVRDDPARNGTDADRYARREYGGPNAQWLLSQSDRAIPLVEAPHDAPVNESLFRRISQVIASIF
jgi:hypothetical protein